MSNAATKVRDVFRDASTSLTLSDIKAAMPELKSSQISMALCYFMRQRYLSREMVKNEKTKGRKSVWLYTFHETKLPPAPTV